MSRTAGIGSVLLVVVLIVGVVASMPERGWATPSRHGSWLEGLVGEKVIVTCLDGTMTDNGSRALDARLVDVLPGGIVLELDKEMFVSFAAIAFIERER